MTPSSPTLVWLKLKTGVMRSSKSGGLKAVLPSISEAVTISCWLKNDCPYRPKVLLEPGLVDAMAETGVGTREGSYSVSLIAPKLKNLSSPKIGLSALSVFVLYGSNTFSRRPRASRMRHLSGIGTETLVATDCGGKTATGL